MYDAIQLMRAWSLGIDVRKLVSNHFMLLQSRAMLVIDKEKAWKTCQVWMRKANESQPL
ncbi:MAG: hypothetical protein ACYSR1_06270 [Planctomycetota bacterium]